MQIRLLISVLAATLMLSNSAFSEEDKKGGLDHSLFDRFTGSYIDDYNYANYDQVKMLGSTLKDRKSFELINVEGQVSQIEYRFKDEGVSVAQIVSHYKKTLSDLSAQIIVACMGESECGARANTFYNTAAKYPMLFGSGRINFYQEFAILTAKIEQNGKTSHVMIVTTGLNDKRWVFQSIVTDDDLVDDQISVGRINGEVTKGRPEDNKGSVEHPLLSRYPRAYIDKYSYADSAQAQMIASTLKAKKTFDLIDVEGRVSQIEYRIKDKTLSAYQIFSNYKKALSDLDATFVVSCFGKIECGAKGQQLYNTAAKHQTLFGGNRIYFDNRFGLMTASLEQDDHAAHVMIVVTSSSNGTRKIYQSIVSSEKENTLEKTEVANAINKPESQVETNAGSLSQSDIDKIIVTAPSILNIVEEATQGLLEDDELRTKLNDAMFAGNPYQVYPQLLANEKQALSRIEKSALDNDYSSYIEFARIADRIHSVITVNIFMTTSASFGKPEEIKNIFEYIDLKSTPDDEKTRLTGYLPDMYERLNTNPADVPIVSKNFDKLSTIFKR